MCYFLIVRRSPVCLYALIKFKSDVHIVRCRSTNVHYFSNVNGSMYIVSAMYITACTCTLHSWCTLYIKSCRTILMCMNTLYDCALHDVCTRKRVCRLHATACYDTGFYMAYCERNSFQLRYFGCTRVQISLNFVCACA